MASEYRTVVEAIQRWTKAGLLNAELARALEVEASANARVSERRRSQYAVSVTAAVVLLICVGVFLRWTWPLMDVGGRSVLGVVLGVACAALGARIHGLARLRPVGQLLHLAGQGILVLAFVYSEQAWADRSLGGVITGCLALAVPVFSVRWAIRRDDILPALNLALGLAFAAIFVDRAAGLDPDIIIWILDVVLLVGGLLLFSSVKSLEGDSHGWALRAFVLSLYAGLVLVFLTATGPLDAGPDAVWPLDVWLAGGAVLAVTGLRRRSFGLEPRWYHAQLALCLVVAIPLGFWTTVEALDAPPWVSALLIGGLGVAALVPSVHAGVQSVIRASCLAILSAAWYWGVESGGALGVVLALGFSAALLFWASARIGSSVSADSATVDGAA